MNKRRRTPRSSFILHRSSFLLALVFLTCTGHKDNREVLTFWSLGSEGEQVSLLIPEFERRNPEVRVVVQQIPWTAAHEKLLTAYVGESTPDVAQMGNTWIPEFVAMRALADVANVMPPEDYFPGIWATNVVAGTVYGIPWYVDTRVLFYRSDILAKAGFPDGPRTWAQWRVAMQRIRQQHLSRYAILLPTNEWEPIVMLALSNHSTLLDPAGTRGEFRQPPFATAFAWYAETFRDGYAPAFSNTQIANLYQQFAQGDFAMYITGPWNVGEFRKRLPAELQDKWATAPLPAPDASQPMGISMAGGSSLVIFKDTKHRAAAEKLIRFLSQPEQQVRFFELTGDLPARRAAWTAPALTREPRFPAFREQLEHVAPLPKVPEWEQIATAILDRGEAAARGAASVSSALNALDARADGLLEKRRWMLARERSAISDQRSAAAPASSLLLAGR
ncbi:MAG TPA: sugar ABC transporter substrate-binding protein [Thermoanaerobaculia bacterium]|jgi:multiple sugar transport system substrate-binding protein|nr:sugar ABC transporter substrate-binding protein [Thermoanaerobaculia bacterium]